MYKEPFRYDHLHSHAANVAHGELHRHPSDRGIERHAAEDQNVRLLAFYGRLSESERPAWLAMSVSTRLDLVDACDKLKEQTT